MRRTGESALVVLRPETAREREVAEALQAAGHRLVGPDEAYDL